MDSIEQIQSQQGKEATAGGANQDLLLKFFITLRRYKALFALVFVVCCALGVWFAFTKGTSHFESNALVYVSPTFIKNVKDDEEHGHVEYGMFVQQQVATFGRYAVLASVLQSLREKGIPWEEAGERENKAVERLRQAVEVRYVPNTYLISVTMSGKTPEVADVLNTVVEKYLEAERDDEFYQRSDRLKTITDERNRLQKELDAAAGNMSSLSRALGVVSAEHSQGNPEDKLLEESRLRLTEAKRRRTEAENQLALLSQDGKSGMLSQEAEELAGADAATRTTIGGLTQRQVELKNRLAGMAQTNPLRAGIEREITDLDAQIAAAPKPAIERNAGFLVKKWRFELEKAKLAEASFAQEVKDHEAVITSLSRQTEEALELQQRMAQLRVQIGAIDDRIAYFRLEANAPGFVRLFSKAQRPTEPTAGNKKKYGGIAILASFGLSLVVIAVITLLDSRVFTPGDIQKNLGFRPLGLVMSGDSLLKEFSGEHFARLVGGLARAHSQFGTQTILVTAASGTSEISDLILKLATEMKFRGLRTLIIDANAIRAESLGMPASISHGFADVLAERSTFQSALIPGEGNTPDRLGVGFTEGNPRLPYLYRAKGAFKKIASQYDIVLIDAPPLLFSGDAEALVTSADATLIVVDSGKTVTAELKRLKALLLRLAPRAAGAILRDLHAERFDSGLKADLRYFDGVKQARARGAELPQLAAPEDHTTTTSLTRR